MKFDKETMPKHIAIIMDGNRRWARAKGKPVSFGHKEGAKTLEKIVRYANKIGLEYITVYAFSTENWKRAEDEVKALCETYKKDFTEVKRWYDGYQLGKYHVYNPNAVVNLMADGSFQSYWSGTASYDLIVPLINMDFDGLKTAIIEMVSGASVEVDVGSFQNDVENIVNKDDVLTYLIHMGYLAYSSVNRMTFVPNEEIRQELIRATKRKEWNEMLKFQQESEDLLDATLDMDGEIVAAQIEKIHEESPDKGYRRLNDDLRHDHGIHVNDKRVLRICRARDIRSTIKYNNHGCTRRAKNPQYLAENLLDRQFYAAKPNEKWLTDVTEFKWFEGV